MKDVYQDIEKWLEADAKRIAIATVVQSWGSSPRKAGAKMVISEAGEISGSVSGGCVEGAVIETAQEILQGGRPRLLHFGVADESAWEVGLACGGSIDVFVELLDPDNFAFYQGMFSRELEGANVTIIQGAGDLLGKQVQFAPDGTQYGSLGQQLDQLASEAAASAGQSQRRQLTNDIEVFIELIRPAPTLVMVGGVHIAVGLARIAQTLGYHTIIIDPRRAFGSEARFPQVDRLIQAWPDKAFPQIELTSATAVAMLTHDPKIDDPALRAALNSPAFYIGALGSRKTHAKRQQRLTEMGFTDEQISRIHGPIGLAIGAATPEEIGLSIMAEVVATFRAR